MWSKRDLPGSAALDRADCSTREISPRPGSIEWKKEKINRIYVGKFRDTLIRCWNGSRSQNRYAFCDLKISNFFHGSIRNSSRNSSSRRIMGRDAQSRNR